LIEHQHAPHLALARAPANWNPVELTLWDQRTRWFDISPA